MKIEEKTATGNFTVYGLIKELLTHPLTARVHLNTHSNWQFINAEEVYFDADRQVVTIASCNPAVDDEDLE